MANEVTIVVNAKDNASSVFAKIEEKGRGIGGLFADIAKTAGGFVIGAGLLKLPGLLSSAVASGSDFAETLSKSNTIFGDSAKDIETWASSAAKGFGQSKAQALDAAATFGNLFVQLGSGDKEAANMSKQMVELASDFASFHNAAPTDVIIAMTAAFRGEYDAVQRYVPVINAAAVEQKALAMGLAKTKKELTAQDKALATQRLLLEGAGDAMGDFDRTAAGAANRTRIMQAQFADLRQEIGSALLPVVLSIGSVLMDKVAPALTTFAAMVAPTVTKVVDAIKGLAFYLRETAISGDSMNDFLQWMPGGMQGVAKAIGDVVVWVKESLIPAIQDFVAVARPKLEEFAATAGEKFAEFKAYYEADIKPALENIRAGFEAVVSWVVEHWPKIMEIAGPILEVLRVAAETTFGVIKGLLDILIQLIGGDFRGAWESMKDIAATAMNGVKEAVDHGLDLLRELMGLFFDLGVQLVRAIIDGIKSAPGAIGSALKDQIPSAGDVGGGILGALKGAPGALMNVGKGMTDAQNSVLSGAATAVRTEFGEAMGKPVSQSNTIGVVNNYFPPGVTQQEGEDIFVLGLQRAGLEAVN